MSEVPSKRKKQVMEHEACGEECLYILKDRANIAYENGDYAEALRCFEQLNQMSSEPLRTPLLHKYGVSLAREGKKDEALVVFNEAIKENRDSLYDVFSGLERAVILLQKGKRKEALAALKHAKKVDARTFDVYSKKKEYSSVCDLLSEID